MNGTARIRVAHLGLGPIGRELVKALLDADHLELVGAADINPQMAGKSLRELVDHPKAGGVRVCSSAEELLEDAAPALVTQTTGSRLDQIYASLAGVVDAGVSLVSTAEELLYPWLRHAQLAEQLHQRAVQRGSRVLGTGINPGFVMDLLPLVLCQPCLDVRRVRAVRVVDVSTRRGQLQVKVGAGLSADEFRARVSAGRLGHVGLLESAALLAHKLGWTLESLEETIEPVLADRPMKTEHVAVTPGLVAGVHQVARGRTDDGRELLLDLTMTLGAADPHDGVQIDGRPPVEVRVPGGYAGDAATVATVVNAIPRLPRMPAGLWTVADLPVSTVPNLWGR